MSERRFLLIILILMVLSGLSADPLIFDHITMEDGLVNNAVSGIVQDRRGYLWFGTQNGLCRYDGKSFLVYDNDPFDRNSLAHNLIQTLYQDPEEHWLWIGTYEGLSRFNPDTGDFRNYSAYADKGSEILSNGVITSIVRDRSGNLWAGTLDGLNRLNPETGEIRSYYYSDSDPGSLLHNTVRALFVDDRDRLWVGTYGGLSLYLPEADSFRHFRADPGNPDALQSPLVMALGQGEDHRIWAGTWDGGVSLLEPAEGRFISHIPMEDNVYLLSPEPSGLLWIGTWGGGLYRYDSSAGRMEQFRSDPDDRYRLNHGIVYSFLKDRTGLYWIGTNGGGVNKLNPRKQDFRYLYHEKDNPLSLPRDRIKALHIDRSGSFWAGTYSFGLWRFSGDPADPEVRHWMPDGENPRALSHHNISCLLEDSAGRIWLGSLGGLDRYDPETEDFTHFSLRGLGYDQNREPIVYALEEDSDGTFWIGTYSQGVVHWSEKEGILEVFSHNQGEAKLSDDLVYCILLDSRGGLWVGTNRGLNRLNRETGKFEFFLHDIDDSRSLSSNVVHYLLEDSSGRIWIGTAGGLNMIEPDSGRFFHYYRKDGLASNNIQTLLEDDAERLWVATVSGLSILDMKDSTILAVDESDGVVVEQMDSGAFKGSDGSLYFGSSEGILRFHTDILYDNLLPPLLWINDFQVMGESVDFQDALMTRRVLEFPWDRNFITFEFAALDFTSPDRNLFRYRLEGLDRDWVYSGNRNFASYPDLSPGEYIFHVQGSNNDGIWNERGLQLPVTIKAPPWKQRWFILIYVLVGLLTVILASNVQANLMLRKKLQAAESSRSNLQLLNTRLEQLAWKDSLTGLSNRRFFDLSLNNLWHLAVRERRFISLMMIDVDHFKAYNDFYGHSMGDEALRRTASVIRRIIRRDTDAVCRYGGEEFTVILYDTNMSESLGLCEALMEMMEEENIPHGASPVSHRLTVSIGLAGLIPDFEDLPEILVNTADKALYQAKDLGRNRIAVGSRSKTGRRDSIKGQE